MERLSIESFLGQGHPYHLYVYEEVLNVPPGAVLSDAARLVPASAVFRDADRATYAAFSDLFRYKLLLERGGYWADTDVICLRRFDFPHEYVFAAEGATSGPFVVGSAVLRGTAGAELFARCYDVASRKDRDRIFFDDIGPLLLTEKIRELDLMRYCLDPRTFYPLGWHEWKHLISDDPEVQARTEEAISDGAHAVHLWNEMWRLEGVDKDATYHPACVYELLKARHRTPA